MPFSVLKHNGKLAIFRKYKTETNHEAQKVNLIEGQRAPKVWGKRRSYSQKRAALEDKKTGWITLPWSYDPFPSSYLQGPMFRITINTWNAIAEKKSFYLASRGKVNTTKKGKINFDKPGPKRSLKGCVNKYKSFAGFYELSLVKKIYRVMAGDYLIISACRC